MTDAKNITIEPDGAGGWREVQRTQTVKEWASENRIRMRSGYRSWVDPRKTKKSSSRAILDETTEYNPHLEDSEELKAAWSKVTPARARRPWTPPIKSNPKIESFYSTPKGAK